MREQGLKHASRLDRQPCGAFGAHVCVCVYVCVCMSTGSQYSVDWSVISVPQRSLLAHVQPLRHTHAVTGKWRVLLPYTTHPALYNMRGAQARLRGT